jgi:hypothetical protein
MTKSSLPVFSDERPDLGTPDKKESPGGPLVPNSKAGVECS